MYRRATLDIEPGLSSVKQLWFSFTTDDSILAVFEVFDRYELGSGARLNLKKCKGLWVGAWRNRTSGPVDIRWSSFKLRCLGAFLGPGDLNLQEFVALLASAFPYLSG